MSVPLDRLPAMYHPWRQFAERFPDWEVRFALLPEGVYGQTDVDQRVIWIDRRLNQAERRSTLTHEVIHAVAEHRECDEIDEARVEQEAARVLLPLTQLLSILPWATTVGEAAEELWVDVDMLRVRLDHLHPSERASLRRAFSARDNTDDEH